MSLQHGRIRAFSCLVSLVMAFSGCNSDLLGLDSISPTGGGGAPSGGADGGPAPTPSGSPIGQKESVCVSSDPNHICLGLKLVSYMDALGVPTVNRADATSLVGEMNQIWSACNIAFQLDEYEAVDPTVSGLSYGSQSESELYDIRKIYGDAVTMLVTVTGPWVGKTIAWTTMPGGGPFGTIVEAQYGHNPMTVGHELGHYQGLYHIKNSTNLMSPYIGSNTSGLTVSQCDIARQTDEQDWQAMMRK
ncbi:matrixin family metalloprotease [Bdellovibrionota bacterium FG-1]